MFETNLKHIEMLEIGSNGMTLIPLDMAPHGYFATFWLWKLFQMLSREKVWNNWKHLEIFQIRFKHVSCSFCMRLPVPTILLHVFVFVAATIFDTLFFA